MKPTFALPALLVLLFLAPACGGSNDSTTTTPTTTGTTSSTELFEGKLQNRGDSSFYSFTVNNSGDVKVTLASVTTSASPGSSSNIVLGLGLGSPVGTECNLTSQVTASAALVAQLTGSSVTPAVYCVRVFDVGNLTVPVNFAIRIVHS